MNEADNTTQAANPYRSAEQSEYAQTIADYLRAPDGLPLLLHGAAGLGKTRAFLLPALAHAAARGQRVLISTATVQLVEQLATSADLQLALAHAGAPLRVARYAAQRQFVSPSRAARHGIAAAIGEATDAVLARSGAALRPEDICLDRRCPHEESLPYREQKARCAEADVVLATHAATILDRRTGGRLLGLERFGVAIFDEADRLPAAASLQLDATIASDELAWLGVPAGGDLPARLTRLLTAVQTRLAQTRSEDETDLLLRLRANAADLLDATLAPQPWRRAAVLADGTLALRVANPARLLRATVERLPAAVFTSGTLAVADRLDGFRHALGLARVHPLSRLVEPRKHGMLGFKLARRELAVDSAPWLDYVADCVRRAGEGGGNVLVLTTSFDLTEALARRLPQACAQRRGETLAALLARFAGGTLISPAAWEGVDLDFAWSDIVIPRIPYPANDEVLELPFLAAQDQAMRRLTQGMARGLRRPEQACMVWLLDPRFPLPARLVNANVATQQQASHHGRLIEAIPRRFRSGLRNSFEGAEIV